MSDLPEAAPSFESSDPPGASSATQTARQWVCPGVPHRRRVLTGIGVLLAAVLFFWLALWQGATMLVSTIIGIVFIGGFVGYLRVVAPPAFTVTLDATGVARAERDGSPTLIVWPDVARVKEERFKTGKTVSLTVYKRVGERGVFRAFVVYRDDIADFDGFVRAVRAGMPAEPPWHVVTVHE
jgi:hypothetical protein